GVDVVLQQHRNAVQLAKLAGPLELSVEGGGELERARVDRRDGVQARPAVLVRANPCEVPLDQLAAGQCSRAQGGMDLPDRRFLDLERLRRLLRKPNERR